MTVMEELSMKETLKAGDERKVEEEPTSVGRFETRGPKDHVVLGYGNDSCNLWFDPPIQSLTKRHLLVN